MKHIEYLRKANEVARRSCAGGNTPFGAILVDEDGQVLMEQGNAEHELHDATAHAERVLASRASAAFDKKRLWGCTLYTTCEPCPMCTGAIYWANIGKIAFGIKCICGRQKPHLQHGRGQGHRRRTEEDRGAGALPGDRRGDCGGPQGLLGPG